MATAVASMAPYESRMTATLNGALCTSVHVAMPRYGYPRGRAVLAADVPAVETQGGALLEVAGISQVCTVTEQGARGGHRGVELVGGFGGWEREAPPESFALGNGVKLVDFARKLGDAVGERVLRSDLAAGRSVGRVVARHRALAADALSAACALPPGSDPVPWWVGLDGATRLEPRAGTAAALPEADAGETDAWRSYETDDATGLLPGCTIDGRTITELHVDATPTSCRLTAFLDSPAPTLFQRAVLAIMGPRVSARTLYRYVFRERFPDGSYRADPVRARLAPTLPSVFLHPGVPGARALPQVGSMLLVTFADGNIGDPVIVAVEPAIAGSRGIPVELDLHASLLRLGPTPTLPCGLGGAAMTIAGGATSFTITITDPLGTSRAWVINGLTGGSVVPTPPNSGTVVIDPGRSTVRV